MLSLDDLSTLAWPIAQLDEALVALANKSGLLPDQAEVSLPALPADMENGTDMWLQAAGARLAPTPTSPIHV